MRNNTWTGTKDMKYFSGTGISTRLLRPTCHISMVRKSLGTQDAASSPKLQKLIYYNDYQANEQPSLPMPSFDRVNSYRLYPRTEYFKVDSVNF